MTLIRPRSNRTPVIRDDGQVGGFLIEHWDDVVDAHVTNPETVLMKGRITIPSFERTIIEAVNKERNK